MFLLENGDKKNDFISFHFISFYLTFYFLRCILHCKKYKLKTYYLTLQSSVHQATPPQEIMTPVTRQTASIHIASHTTRYDYLNAARKNIATDDNKQQDYDQECFDGGDDARISTSTRTTRNSKLKHQQQEQQQEQQQIINKKTKTVAFANQKQEQEQAPVQEQKQQQQPKGKMLSKRQAKKYDAQIEAVEAASILTSIAAAAASASKKERTPPYWTRQHEKAKAGARLQKAMSSVLECDE
jgi:hypothetical protein